MSPTPAILSARALRDLIAENRAEILGRWLERAANDLIRSPGLELTQLRDGLPDYLDALTNVLGREQIDDLKPSSEAAWSKVAGAHGLTRVRLGFDISELIHEFIVLRCVISGLAEEKKLASWDLHRILSNVIDAAIGASVKAYVEARDYDARSKEAENIAFVSHELRNPLNTAVLAASQLRLLATERQLRALEKLERSHQRLVELIDSVLLTQKLEAGKIKPDRIPVKLGEVLDPALEGARTEAERKGLTFKASFDAELVVSLDPALTRSAVQNVIDNAVKYTDHGQVEMIVDDAGGDLVLHVRDNCAGISSQELRTIFEPFERGQFGARGKTGTGLGLAIARRAVEAQGGSIEAESPAASGCHFWITLPKHQAA